MAYWKQREESDDEQFATLLAELDQYVERGDSIDLETCCAQHPVWAKHVRQLLPVIERLASMDLGEAVRQPAPLCSAPSLESRVNRSTRKGRPDGMRRSPIVSIIDMDITGSAGVEQFLRAMGVSSVVYRSGQEFLDRLDPEQPGCVILEVRIPGTNGLELQQELAARKILQPVIYLTEHGTVSIAVQALRAGAVHFLEKPFRESELWQAVSEALNQDEQQRQAQLRIRQAQAKIERLTEGERQMAEKIVAGQTNRKIAADLGVCLRTVELRRSRMMRKLQINSPGQLIQLLCALRNGNGYGPLAGGSPGMHIRPCPAFLSERCVDS